jgi:lysyl-tRNA synthetase class 2
MAEPQVPDRRHDFLLTHWSRYPAWPSAQNAAPSGDASRLWKSGRWPLQLAHTLSAKLRWHALSLRGVEQADEVARPAEVLREGDWVSVDEASAEVILWSPNRLEVAAKFAKADLLATERWCNLLTSLRRYFLERGFREASTPFLAPSPGTEAYLDSVSVRLRRWDGAEFTRYAITSPEFHLKKILAAGCDKVFEIARCVRNLEGGHQHALEFHMLEWYRSFASHREIAEDLTMLLESLGAPRPTHRTWLGLVVEAMEQRGAWSHLVVSPFKRHEEREEFLCLALQAQDLTELPDATAVRAEPTQARQALRALLTALQVEWREADGVNDLLQRLWLERIEDLLAKDRPMLVEDFPPALSALARVNAEGWAERFELYWRGLEIANAFHELNDPEENHQRWQRDLLEKRRSGRPEVPVDQELAQAFLHGVPPAGGIALGVERLAMALWNLPNINEVRPFVY